MQCNSLIKYFALYAVTAMVNYQALAVLDAPELSCASVLPNGDVQLTWVQPPDPLNEFDEYRLFGSNSLSGPYTQIGTVVNYNTTTFTHVGAAANTAIQYYFVHAISVGPPPNQSLDSDTLATMLISVGQSTPLGSAVLSWNAQHSPPISSSAQEYLIWMEYPVGTWTVLDTVGTSPLNYSYTVSICSDTLSFRVSMASSNGCVSFSSVSGDRFEDSTPPTAPRIITASVDTATGLATFKWEASPEFDTQGYIMVEVINTGSVIIDTVFGQFNTTYTDPIGDPAVGSQTYTIASFDTCYSGTPPQPNTSATLPGQSTIHLTGAYDECAPSISLSWTPYTGWDSLLTYELFVEMDNGSPQLLAVLGPNESDYLDETVVPFVDYCYFVKATGADTCEVSFSNRYCITTDYPGLPAFNYLRTASVVNDELIQIVARVDVSAKVSRYRLERARNDGPFLPIATQGPSLTNDILFNDSDVEADEFSYSYRIVVEDSCGNDAITSNTGSTMWLRVTPELSGINNLSWNGYQNWDGQVFGYNIYRSVSGAPYVYLATVPPLQWFFEDNVNAFEAESGSFCYYVEAVESGGGSFAPDTLSLSNVACAVQQDQLYLPNAFTPNGDGVNDWFRGYGSFADLSELKFLIFNRWGQPIWETSDADEFWDGEINGKPAPQGIYGYIYAYSDGGGNRVERTGTVTLIRGTE